MEPAEREIPCVDTVESPVGRREKNLENIRVDEAGAYYTFNVLVYRTALNSVDAPPSQLHQTTLLINSGFGK